MEEDFDVGIFTNQPSHRMFPNSPKFPMSKAMPGKRKRQKYKKYFAEKVIPGCNGILPLPPQPSKGRNAKRHAYKRAKRQEQN